MATIKWNPAVKLIISDVDETIADLYVDAEPEMISELRALLEAGMTLFLISGQGIGSINNRIIRHIRKDLRRRILVGHCSGAEVLGFGTDGKLLKKPYYSIYDEMLGASQKKTWRKVIRTLVKDFQLKTLPTMPIPEFGRRSGGEPLTIMLEDRGPQITFELVNGYDMDEKAAAKAAKKISFLKGTRDLRVPIYERAEELLKQEGLPITPRIAGVFALDFALKGVSKTTAVRYVIENGTLLRKLGLPSDISSHPELIEVWGDKFSASRGGTDRHMSEALPKKVRSITFRPEEPSEFPRGFNIVVWDGREHLHEGLLEFLHAWKNHGK